MVLGRQRTVRSLVAVTERPTSSIGILLSKKLIYSVFFVKMTVSRGGQVSLPLTIPNRLPLLRIGHYHYRWEWGAPNGNFSTPHMDEQ